MLSPEAGFPFLHSVEVRFRDLDLFGHVNNAVFLTYLESARLGYWMKLTEKKTLREIDLIVARVEIDYRSQAVFGETLDVLVGCHSLGRSSFGLAFRVREQAQGRLVAEARKVLVYYDFAAGKSRPIPEGLRALIQAQIPTPPPG